MMFEKPVIITCDGAGSDICHLADARISDIAEMVHFGTLLQVRVFNFNKIAHLDVVRQPGARANAGIRAQLDTVTDLRIFNMAERTDEAA